VRPGREHDTTALREHNILPLLTAWTGDDDLRVLGDLGYEGEAATITVAFKNRRTGPAPPSSSSSTEPTTPSAPSVNAGTHCSRRPSKH
jgi:hypothetical protein